MWCAARRLNKGGFEWPRSGRIWPPRSRRQSSNLMLSCWGCPGAGWNKCIPLRGCGNCPLTLCNEQLEDALTLTCVWILHNTHMFRVHQLSPQDFVGLSPTAAAELTARVLAQVGEQSCKSNHKQRLLSSGMPRSSYTALNVGVVVRPGRCSPAAPVRCTPGICPHLRSDSC